MSNTLSEGERAHVEACRRFVKDDVKISVRGTGELLKIIDKLNNTLSLHAGDVVSMSGEVDEFKLRAEQAVAELFTMRASRDHWRNLVMQNDKPPVTT